MHKNTVIARVADQADQQRQLTGASLSFLLLYIYFSSVTNSYSDELGSHSLDVPILGRGVSITNNNQLFWLQATGASQRNGSFMEPMGQDAIGMTDLNASELYLLFCRFL